MRTIAVALLVLVAGCGDEKSGGSDEPDLPEENAAVTAAREEFPRFAELQNKILASTCSPNPGVCHNSSNYPNLETAGNSITWIGAACNTELPTPEDGWDSCEQAGHVLVAGTGAFVSDIAWIEKAGEGAWDVRMADPSPVTRRTRVSFDEQDGTDFFVPDPSFQVAVDLVQGSQDAFVSVNTINPVDRQFVDSIIATVLGGDPNHNDIWGAASEPSGAVIYPGDLSRSYLWGRITGTVPGSRMPLANAPITFPGYIAIACWIEGLDDALAPPQTEDPIDYDACSFADAPIDYTIQ